jgi:hypothetical protein
MRASPSRTESPLARLRQLLGVWPPPRSRQFALPRTVLSGEARLPRESPLSKQAMPPGPIDLSGSSLRSIPGATITDVACAHAVDWASLLRPGDQMSEIAETQYAKTHDGVHIAYQTLGDGPSDVVLWPEWITNCEVLWEQPVFHTALHRTASFARVIFFDKRGIGLSDRVAASEVPSLETWVDDLKTILEAVGSDRPVLLSLGHGGVLAMLFAATYPERVGGLILINSYARLIQGPGYPYGYPPEWRTTWYPRPRRNGEPRAGWSTTWLRASPTTSA